MPSLGTRTSNLSHNSVSTRSYQLFNSRDPGVTSATASMTFVSATGQVTAANGTFAGATFRPGLPVLIEGSNLNSGVHLIAAIDSINQSFLTLYEGVKDEGPIAVTVRPA